MTFEKFIFVVRDLFHHVYTGPWYKHQHFQDIPQSIVARHLTHSHDKSPSQQLRLEVLDLVPRPQQLTISNQQKRHRNQCHSDERQQTVSPTQSKCVIHPQAEDGKDSSKDTSRYRVSRKSRRSVDGEGVDQGLSRIHQSRLNGSSSVNRQTTHHADCHEDNDIAEPNQCVAHNRHNPMDVVLGGPAIDEETSGQEYGTDGENLEPILGGACSLAVRTGFGLHDAVAGDAEENEADEGANAHADEDQADDLGTCFEFTTCQQSEVPRNGGLSAHTEVVSLRISKHPRDRGEHEVHVPIHDRDIYRKDDANRAENEHLQRPDNAAFEVIGRTQSDIQLAPQHLVARLLAQPVNPSLEEHGSVRLPSEPEHAQRHHARQDRQDPKHPAPAQVRVADDTTDDGRDDGTQQHAHRHERHRRCSLLLRDHVGNRPAAVRHRTTAENARKKAERDERVETGRLGTSDQKGNKAHVTPVVNIQSSIDLAQGRDHQRASRETENVNRHHEGSQFRRRVVEFSHHRGHAGSEDGRCQRSDEGLRADETHVEDLDPAWPVIGVFRVIFGPPDYIGVVFLFGGGVFLRGTIGGRFPGCFLFYVVMVMMMTRPGLAGMTPRPGERVASDGLFAPFLALLVEYVADVGWDVGVVTLVDGLFYGLLSLEGEPFSFF